MSHILPGFWSAPCCLGREHARTEDNHLLHEQPDMYLPESSPVTTSGIGPAPSVAKDPASQWSPSIGCALLERLKANSDGGGSVRLMQGKQLEDNYTSCGTVLGKGMHGGTYLVEHRRTGEQRALKTLNIPEGSSQSDQDLVANEVETFLRLDHPNICRLLEVYIEDTKCHMVMELCSGRDLWEQQANRGRLSEREACIAVHQMLGAISYLHRLHICHRDLKLENWLYQAATEDAKLKLIDFGYAKTFSSKAPMRDVVGSIHYISPEMWRGSYDCKCDLWSIGVMSYELLSGSPPFDAADDMAIRDAVVTGQCSMSGDLWKNISEDAKSFVAGLLQPNPSLRPSARRALRHPWFAGQGTCAKELPEDLNVLNLGRLCSFASASFLPRAVGRLLATLLAVEETEQLEAHFRHLDKTGRGCIRVQDLAEEFQVHLNMSAQSATSMARKLSLSGDKDIKYSEFLVGASQHSFLSREHVIRQAFERFDVDQKGVISLDDMRAVLGGEFCSADIMPQGSCKDESGLCYDVFLEVVTDRRYNRHLGAGNDDSTTASGRSMSLTDLSDLPDAVPVAKTVAQKAG